MFVWTERWSAYNKVWSQYNRNYKTTSIRKSDFKMNYKDTESHTHTPKGQKYRTYRRGPKVLSTLLHDLAFPNTWQFFILFFKF